MPTLVQHVLILLAFRIILLPATCAQVVRNGQIFTNGLTIVDAPALNSDLHPGSGLNLAIDVSGNGKLASSAQIPGSSQDTRYDGLEVYLVSSLLNVNLTVSSGPGLLTQESGSTVKHFTWPIPTCLPSGQYNLTLYETSHIDGVAYFSITPIPLQLSNASPSGTTCTFGNNLQDVPQASSPPPQSPFLPSPNPDMITITLSESGGLPFDFNTITATAPPTTYTIVVVSLETVTTTEEGKTVTATSTYTSTSTGLGVMNQGQFVPINGSFGHKPFTLLSLLWCLGSLGTLYLSGCIS